ncbi:LacI family DNA-binding transcriptional regulator [Jannaschia formosa]|uniref:LacI family DNA-binding transcriptional regulator n=1 Tax=Jannaschia formosa TaxID=2259592 RepID=UPI000E1C1F23|nr:LacI family DNA-binding transcriptional regulator [Jannaschia formosa]TFL17835.1 LacI family DNA-binding transcriptional regulator [Jannaschia formosa]
MNRRDETINIHKVASAAGVSPATVSRVMNHPQMVGAETRRKVTDAIRETGYIRNRAAQAMHGRRSATIGLIVPTVDYAIFASLVQSFGDKADELGFTLLLASHGYDLGREYQILRKFLEHRVDGVALIGLDHTEDSFALLASQRTPAIAVWNHDPASRLPSVGARNAEAGAVAARHLVALGHRRVALLFPPDTENDRARLRRSAVLSVLDAAGIEVPPEYHATSYYDIAPAKAAATRLLDLDRPPTAILCGNDVIARAAIYAAAARGLSIPGDISIVGIGDFQGSADMVPALTTVRIPATRIGAEAATRLIDMIVSDHHPEDTGVGGCEFPVELVPRDTTDVPKEASERKEPTQGRPSTVDSV